MDKMDSAGGNCSSNSRVAEDSTINDTDKKNVKSTWTKMFDDWDANGHEFYIRMLNNQPNVKKTFKTFSTMSDDELTNDATFRAHVLLVGKTINSWIDSLDDTDALVVLIHKLTDSHVMRGITDKPLFKAVLEELLAYMKDKLKLTSDQVTSWKKIAGVISSVIDQRINDLK